MKRFFCALAAAALAFVAFGALAYAAAANADEIVLDLEPACPYGYYDTTPYACAPSGYYGQEWFVDGGFLGAGPWFHGPTNFRGHVDKRLDARLGYRGPLPQRGERAQPVAGRR